MYLGEYVATEGILDGIGSSIQAAVEKGKELVKSVLPGDSPATAAAEHPNVVQTTAVMASKGGNGTILGVPKTYVYIGGAALVAYLLFFKK